MMEREQDMERGGVRLIGLTGKYCSGKNLVAGLLEKRGLPVLDVDKLGHEAIETERRAIIAGFGEEVAGEDGHIDRKRLGAKVFGRPAALAALEAIVHPEVNRMTAAWIEAQGGRPCVINAALLHRSSAFGELDAVILVEAPLLVRLLRARRRDALPWSALARRFLSQRNFTSQYPREKTDVYRVRNENFFRFDEEALERRLRDILARLGLAGVQEEL